MIDQQELNFNQNAICICVRCASVLAGFELALSVYSAVVKARQIHDTVSDRAERQCPQQAA